MELIQLKAFPGPMHDQIELHEKNLSNTIHPACIGQHHWCPSIITIELPSHACTLFFWLHLWDEKDLTTVKNYSNNLMETMLSRAGDAHHDIPQQVHAIMFVRQGIVFQHLNAIAGSLSKIGAMSGHASPKWFGPSAVSVVFRVHDSAIVLTHRRCHSICFILRQ